MTTPVPPGIDTPGECYDLLTVDVWDTLLRRRCHPDGVKLHVARYLELNFGASLAEEARDPWQLLRLRQRAEKELGDEAREHGLDDEYRHRDVYRRWLSLAGLSSLPDGEEGTERLIEALAEIELAQERYVSYADPHVAKALSSYDARRRIFLSDFYLPAESVSALLAHHGMADIVPDGVVSCDVGLNKRSGRLYRHVQELFAVPAHRHAHLGDNLHSDVRAARSAGVAASHFQPEQQHRVRQRHERGFADRRGQLEAAQTELMALDLPERHALGGAYDFGRQCALLPVAFVLWTMEMAIRDGVQALYFFTREGEFFREIYLRLAASDVLGFAPPRAELLKVSRLATFAGSLREFSVAELMRLWNQYSVQSLGALFVSLDLEPEAFAAAVARHGLDLEIPIRYPWQDPRVLALLADQPFLAEMRNHVMEKRQYLRDYLASMGLDGATAAVAIVDIGWRGTIQDNLAYVLPATTLHGYYLALSRFLNPQPENVSKSAFGPNLNEAGADSELLAFVAPIEMMFNSDNGSVTGYTRGSSGMEVHRHVDPAENEIHAQFTRHFQQGVLDAVPYWADICRTHAYSSAELRPLALNRWAQVIHRPPGALASAYFKLNHNETFGVGGFLDKRRMLSTPDLLMAIFSPRYRTKLKAFLAEMGWPEGLFACTEVHPLFRLTLRWLLRAVAARRWLWGRLA